MKLLIATLVLLCTYSAIVQSQSARQQDEPESFTKVGQQMPAFTVTELGGREINITNSKGKILLVTFWATWCGPCITEMPRLEKQIWRKFKSDDFVMIAISREESEQEITKFRNEYGYSFPMAADPEREVYKMFAKEGIPRSYVVGTDGRILYQSIGYSPSEFARMKKLIEKELKQLPKPKVSA